MLCPLVRLQFLPQFSFSKIVFMFLLSFCFIIRLFKTSRKAFTFTFELTFLLLFEINIAIFFYTKFVVREEPRRWGIISFDVPRSGE